VEVARQEKDVAIFRFQDCDLSYLIFTNFLSVTVLHKVLMTSSTSRNVSLRTMFRYCGAQLAPLDQSKTSHSLNEELLEMQLFKFKNKLGPPISYDFTSASIIFEDYK
jgi:hypothetical protein